MGIIYDDEDNAPMVEDPWLKYSVYSCKGEADYYESGQWEADEEAKEAARDAKQKECMDGILDMLQLTGGCRKCSWIIETAEGFIAEGQSVSSEQLDYLHLMCVGCHGKGTGEMQPEHDARLTREWGERVEFIKNAGMSMIHCPWCPKFFEVYGKYKDPDDEWNALDSKERCMNCKCFEED